MRIKMLGLASLLALSCGAEDEGWQFEDEPIVIWTIPRPGEEPETEPTPDETTPDETPAVDSTPALQAGPSPLEPSVWPVACDAELETVTVPGSVTGTLQRGRGQIHEMPCATADGQEMRFRLEVPRTMGVQISSTYEEMDFPPVLLLQSSCDAGTTDLACSTPLGSKPDGYSSWIRTVLEPGFYTLVVDERNLLDYGEGGNFVVHVTEVEIDANAMCEAPDQLWPDNIGTVPNVDGGSTGLLTECFGASRALNFWSMQVPAGQSYRVRATYDDISVQQGPYIKIRESCSGACDGAAGYDSVSIANETGEAHEYMVTVSANGHPYRVYVETIADLANNAQCVQAQQIPPNERIAGNLMRGAAQESLCGHNQTRQLFYEVDVPPGHRLLPSVTSGTVVAQPACGAEQCVDTLVNQSAVSERWVLAVGDLAGQATAFDLTADVAALAPNGTCAAASALEPDVPLWGSLRSGGETAGTCQLVFGSGFTLWYSATIPPQTTAQVSVHGASESGLALEAMMECDGECVAVYDPYYHGSRDPVLDLPNPSDTPVTVLLAVTNERRIAADDWFEITLDHL